MELETLTCFNDKCVYGIISPFLMIMLLRLSLLLPLRDKSFLFEPFDELWSFIDTLNESPKSFFFTWTKVGTYAFYPTINSCAKPYVSLGDSQISSSISTNLKSFLLNELRFFLSSSLYCSLYLSQLYLNWFHRMECWEFELFDCSSI